MLLIFIDKLIDKIRSRYKANSKQKRHTRAPKDSHSAMKLNGKR